MKSKLFRIIIACAFTFLVAGCGKYEMAPSVEETINTTVEIEQVEEPAVTVAVEEAEPEPEPTVEVVDDAWKDAYVNFITKAAADVNAGKYELGSDWPQSYYVYDVTGVGYNVLGEITSNYPIEKAKNIAKLGAINNEATFENGKFGNWGDGEVLVKLTKNGLFFRLRFLDFLGTRFVPSSYQVCVRFG